MNPIVRSIGQAHEKRKLDPFEIGDVVNVHVRIREGEKERIQIFTGTVIARKGIKNRNGELTGDITASFTVRRLSQNAYGVERVFPLHCRSVEKVEVQKRSRVRRSKLYYLRDRTGKRAKLKERRLRRADEGNEAQSPQPEAGSEPDEAEAPETAEASAEGE